MPTGIYKRTELHRKKISAAGKGRIAWNKGLRGRKLSKETKKKMSESHKGHKSWNKGLSPTKETKAKISQALKGKKVSNKHRKNLSSALKGNKNCLGRKLSKEHIEKLRQSNLGKKRSEETKRKMREAKLKNPNMYWLGRHRNDKVKKKISQTLKGKYAGENSPTWQGGKSFEPYGLDFNDDLREVIRNRDRRKCQICSKTELENGQKLDVHHIDQDKKNNDPKNLISLCHNCHAKIHHSNEEYWINYFKNYKILWNIKIL